MAKDQTEHSVPNYDINFRCTFPLARMVEYGFARRSRRTV